METRDSFMVRSLCKPGPKHYADTVRVKQYKRRLLRWQIRDFGGTCFADLLSSPLARRGRAMFHLGELFYNGRGVAENRSAAVAWWRRAARAGNAAAKKKLAQLRLPIYTTASNRKP